MPPLILEFDFNPSQITRTRTITIKEGGGRSPSKSYDFNFPHEVARVSQGVSAQPETFDVSILLDAQESHDNGDPSAKAFGIEHKIVVLRVMIEPKKNGMPGGIALAELGLGSNKAASRKEYASVLLFIWGTHILPVFLTSIQVKETAHFANLRPARAEVTLSMQVLEGNNPFYQVESLRQFAGSVLGTGSSLASILV